MQPATHDHLHMLTRDEIDGIPIHYAAGADARARSTAQRIARASAWLRTTWGETAAPRILVLDEATWPIHATFPVYGMPHYTDSRTLAVAAKPAPFLQGVLDAVNASAAPPQRELMAKAYGTPADPMRFFDLLAVHELGHLHAIHRRVAFSQGWILELYCNMLLHGYVVDREPNAIDQLTVLPAVGSMIPASAMRHQELASMHTDVDIDPMNYGWFQMNLHALAKHLWHADGPRGVERFERELGAGQAIDPARLRAISPTLARFHEAWPAWRDAF